MPSLENKIRGIINKKKETLKEDAVQPAWTDLGPAPTDPHGALPDYTKGITPGQAGLPPMNPTPGVGTVVGDGKQFKPQQEITEDKDDDTEDKGEKDGENPDKKPEDVTEDNTADQENERQYAKIRQGEKMQSVKDPANPKDDDDEDENKKDIKEDVEALFAGEKLTPAFKKKAAVIFEAAVTARVNAIVEKEAERLMNEYSTAVENFKTDLTEKVDQYLNYVAGEWLTENTIAIDTGIRNELVEDFLVGLKNLFTETYIDVPADKVDVVEALAERVEELETNLNEQIEANVALKEENKGLERHKLVMEASKGLTEVQSDKLVQLAEGLEFKDSESFNESLKVLKENQIVTKPKKAQDLTEDTVTESFTTEKKPKNEIGSVLEALKRTSR